MKLPAARRRVDELRRTIETHNRLYYQEARPEISDRDFDALLAELEALESAFPELQDPSSPTQRVGGEPLDAFVTVPHSAPMLSLGNTYSTEELRQFDARIRRHLKDDAAVAYVAELKIDGVGVALRYRDGTFALGLTRGDGRQGDDITQNLRTLADLPVRLRSRDGGTRPSGGTAPSDEAMLSGEVEIRGEVYIPRPLFASWNARREAEGLARFMNPRNTAAGTLKMLDHREVARRPLRLFCYSIVTPERLGLEAHHEVLEWLEAAGLPVEPHHARLVGIEAAIAHCDSWAQRRTELEYETDGMVLKVDRHDLRDKLGFTSKAPRWGIAYKFETEEAVTEVLAIDVQVGRTGSVTPVAHLAPVEILGTIVKRATLHNADEVERLDVRVGDWVAIEKGGEIIPKVTRVLTDRRTGRERRYRFPKNCPVCDGPLVREEGEVAIRCVNEFCPAQTKARILHFAGRGALDLDGVGEVLVEQLVDGGLVADPADLYRLDVETLAALERMGTKSARNIVEGLEARRQPPLDRFLFALGIRHVGTTAARLLAEHAGTLEAARNAALEDLVEISGIGEEIARSVVEYFGRPETDRLLKKFAAAGVAPAPYARVSAGDDRFAGRTFVITGTLERWSRQGASEAVTSRGGKVASSVSAKTDFLVAGAKPGSKLTKAQALGVPVLDEAAFEALLEP